MYIHLLLFRLDTADVYASRPQGFARFIIDACLGERKPVFEALSYSGLKRAATPSSPQALLIRSKIPGYWQCNTRHPSMAVSSGGLCDLDKYLFSLTLINLHFLQVFMLSGTELEINWLYFSPPASPLSSTNGYRRHILALVGSLLQDLTRPAFLSPCNGRAYNSRASSLIPLRLHSISSVIAAI